MTLDKRKNEMGISPISQSIQIIRHMFTLDWFKKKNIKKLALYLHFKMTPSSQCDFFEKKNIYSHFFLIFTLISKWILHSELKVLKMAYSILFIFIFNPILKKIYIFSSVKRKYS